MPNRVLVVDDEHPIRSLVVSILSEGGWSAAEAASGNEALDYLARERFDVLVLDLNMPVMDGPTFYREMLKQGDPIPTVILSAHGAAQAARELGACAALEKPFDIDTLVALVDSVGNGAPK